MGWGTAVNVGLGMAGISLFQGQQANKQNQKYINQQIAGQNEIADLQIAALQAQMGMGGGGGGGGGGAAAAAMRAAAARTRAIGLENAKKIRKEGARTVKQRGKEHASTLGTATAKMAASGMKASSESFGVYKDDMKKENKDEIKWIEETVESQAKAAIEGADFEASMAEMQAAGIGGGGGGSPGAAGLAIQSEIDQINAMRGIGAAQLKAQGGGGGGFFGSLLSAGQAGLGGWGLFK